MATIADVVAAGKEFGIFDFYLPFIIMFAVVFGILSKTKIFGTDSRVDRLNVIIAGGMSLFVMIYTPAGVTLAGFLSSLFAESLIVIVTIIAILIVLYLVFPILGIKTGDLTEPRRCARWVIIFIIILGIGVFISSGGLAFFPGLTFGNIPNIPTILLPGLTSQDVAIVVLALLTLLVFVWIVKGGDEGRKRGGRTTPVQQSPQP